MLNSYVSRFNLNKKKVVQIRDVSCVLISIWMNALKFNEWNVEKSGDNQLKGVEEFCYDLYEKVIKFRKFKVKEEQHKTRRRLIIIYPHHHPLIVLCICVCVCLSDSFFIGRANVCCKCECVDMSESLLRESYLWFPV